MAINWYPGHMHKATKELKETLPKVDVIIEVLDGRIPYSSQNPVIKNLQTDKPRIKLLNKSDLADPKMTKLWVKHFKEVEGVNTLAIHYKQADKINLIMEKVFSFVSDKKRESRNVNALITGIPNVGKSTLINALVGKQIAKTGNEPAVTKGQQRIDCGNGLMLFDTPGILWPKVHNQHSSYRLAVTGAIKNTAMDLDDVAFYACEYLLKAYPDLLMKTFKFDKLPKDEMSFFQELGRKRGRLGKGGVVNIYQMTEIFLNELRSGQTGRITFETPEMQASEELQLEIK